MPAWSTIAVALASRFSDAQHVRFPHRNPSNILTQSDASVEIARIKQEIRATTKDGQAVAGVPAWINDQLLPQVRETAQELQGEVDRAEQAVNDCKSLLWSAEKEVAQRESILEKDESDRFQCLALEHKLHKDESDACGDLKFLADLVVREQPKSISSLTNRTLEDIEQLLRESHDFFNDYYPKMLDRSNACASAKEAAANQHSECEADEEVIEQFYCTMQYGRDQSCKQYDECYASKAKLFEKAIAEVKDLEGHTKDRFKKLTCYSRLGEDSSSSACDTAAVNVAHLSVSYPVKPQKQTCVKLLKTRRDYTSVECKEGSIVPHGDHPGDAPVADEQSNSTESNTTALLSSSSGKTEVAK